MSGTPIRRRLRTLRADLNHLKPDEGMRPHRSAASERLANTLIVVPCGARKIWRDQPWRGAVTARDAYTSDLFRTNRDYAQMFGERWVVLSAKYGFIDPDFEIPGPYECTFNDPGTQTISFDELCRQRSELHLDQYERVVGLGGKEYRTIVAEVFGDTSADVTFPFAGLSIGLLLQATTRAIQTGTPIPQRESRPQPPAAVPRLVRGHERRPYILSYRPLAEWLEHQPPDREITCSFQQLEQLLGQQLPRSAYELRPWWGNSRTSQARGWLGAGRRVQRVDFRAQSVTFSAMQRDVSA
jgi:hypothetical protein